MWTLLIFFMILSFGYPCWIPTNEKPMDRARNFKICLFLIGCSIFTIDALIIDTFLDINARLIKRGDQVLLSISTIFKSVNIILSEL